MATNCSVAGLAFFGMSSVTQTLFGPKQTNDESGIREYLVSPILLQSQITAAHGRRYDHLTDNQRGKLPEDPSLFIGDIRTNRLLDSAISGAIAGGSLSWGLRWFFLISCLN